MEPSAEQQSIVSRAWTLLTSLFSRPQPNDPTTSISQSSRVVPQASEEPEESEVATMLKDRSVAIIRAFNERDTARPYAQYAAKDFIYIHESPKRTANISSAEQARDFVHGIFAQNIEHLAEVTSSAAQVNEDAGFGTVWLGIRLHGGSDGFMPGAEKVNILQWRREGGLGDENWVWYHHMSLKRVAPFP